jgi:hypothetical protein
VSVLAAILIIGGLGGVAVATALGFRPPQPLSQFRASRMAPVRYFQDPPELVQRAYANAVGRTPGMRLVHEQAGLLYVDSRPTSRVLNGDFGVVLLARFVAHQRGTQVDLGAQAKVGRTTRTTTLTELERAWRMRAKTAGVREHIG